MNTRLGILGVILALQSVLISTLQLSSAPSHEADELIDLDAGAVQSLTIADLETSVIIERQGEEDWQVAGWPADAAKVRELIDDFADMAAPWPAATTASSAARFEVTEEAFQRRIELRSEDGVLGVVYLGTSPGFQRVHARVEGSGDVYAIDFSNFKAPTTTDDWLDKALLATVGQPRQVRSSDGFELRREDDLWLVDGADADVEAARAYVDRFENLRVLGVRTETPELAQSAGTLTLVDEVGELTFEILRVEDEEDYFVRSSRRPGVFELATYIAEQLLTDRDDLLPDVQAPPAEAADS